MIYPHTLSKKNKHHKSFLKEKRKDPITGDVIVEGDMIVLCGACKSAFLLDSWNYMDNKHCNQHFTLKEIPSRQHVQKEIEEEQKYDFKMQSEKTASTLQLIMMFLGIVSVIAYSENKTLGFTCAIISFLLFVTSIFLVETSDKLKISKSKVVFSFFFQPKTFYSSEIEKLEFMDKTTDEPKDKKHLPSILFILFLTNSQIKRIKIIKDKDTITKIKKLQKEFKASSLEHKITLYEE